MTHRDSRFKYTIWQFRKEDVCIFFCLRLFLGGGNRDVMSHDQPASIPRLTVTLHHSWVARCLLLSKSYTFDTSKMITINYYYINMDKKWFLNQYSIIPFDRIDVQCLKSAPAVAKIPQSAVSYTQQHISASFTFESNECIWLWQQIIIHLTNKNN